MGQPQDSRERSVSYFVTVRTFGCRSVFDDASKAATLVDVIETRRRQVGFKKYGYVVLSINRTVERFLSLADDGQPLWDDEPEVLVLYTPRSRLEKLNYIHRKPVLCGVVDSPEDYDFSSARFYFARHGKCIFDF